MAFGNGTVAPLAAEASVACEKPTADDFVRAASVYLLQGDLPAHRASAHEILDAADAEYPLDERITRLLFAVETETHRHAIGAQHAKVLLNNRELERFQAASTEEHRESILKSWANGFLLRGAF